MNTRVPSSFIQYYLFCVLEQLLRYKTSTIQWTPVEYSNRRNFVNYLGCTVEKLDPPKVTFCANGTLGKKFVKVNCHLFVLKCRAGVDSKFLWREKRVFDVKYPT